MYYTFEITSPANTTETTPTETSLSLPPGRIVRATARFPQYSGGQLHFRIRRGLHQIWPLNADSSIRGDNEVVEFEREFDIYPEEGDFTVESWNDDDSYSHAVLLRFLMVPFEHVDSEERTVTWLERLAVLLGWKKTRQEEPSLMIL